MAPDSLVPPSGTGLAVTTDPLRTPRRAIVGGIVSMLKRQLLASRGRSTSEVRAVRLTVWLPGAQNLHGLTVRLDGRDVTHFPPRKLLELGICYVPQGRNIFPELSVRHNLELGATAAGAGFETW